MGLSGGSKYELVDDCDGPTDAIVVDPSLIGVPSDIEPTVVSFDPRPVATGPALENIDTVPADGFFVQTTYKGAFAPDEATWLEKWSWISETGKLVAYIAPISDVDDSGADDADLTEALKVSVSAVES